MTLGHLQPSPLTEESLELAEWGADPLAAQAAKLQAVNVFRRNSIFAGLFWLRFLLTETN